MVITVFVKIMLCILIFIGLIELGIYLVDRGKQ